MQCFKYRQVHVSLLLENITSLPKVIWEEGHVAALLHTYAVKSPLVTMAHPKFAPKSTASRGPIAKPQYLPDPWTRRPMMPNGIRIRSAVFPQFHNALQLFCLIGASLNICK